MTAPFNAEWDWGIGPAGLILLIAPRMGTHLVAVVVDLGIAHVGLHCAAGHGCSVGMVEYVCVYPLMASLGEYG